jgi:hypothetical protein
MYVIMSETGYGDMKHILRLTDRDTKESNQDLQKFTVKGTAGGRNIHIGNFKLKSKN